MDFSINPCENFYEFACGTYVENTVIPDEMLKVTKFSLLDDILKRQLSDLLSKTHDNESKTFDFARGFYASCMNKCK